jgi:tRNA threonylcarbamoyladenosine biosynthesis protein TsaE
MGHVFKVHAPTPVEMLQLGNSVGSLVFEGAVIGLIGPLGAGKTTLARGIAEGMGIHEGYVVSSPTYTLMQIYPCRDKELYHLDLYRISGPDDLDSTGYRDATGEGRVLIVEWPDRVPSVLPRENLKIQIEYSGDGRNVRFMPAGKRYEKLVRAFVTDMN